MKRLLLLLIPTMAWGTPTIATLTGTPGNGNTLTIASSGSDYETHPNSAGNQKPYWYADFESGTNAPDATFSLVTAFTAETQAKMSASSVDKAEGTYSLRGDLSTEGDSFSEAFIRVESNFSFGLNNHVIFGLHRKNTSTETTKNWKHWRGWALDDDIYPDFYIGNAPSDGSQIYTEACNLDDATGAHTQDYYGFTKPSSTWQFDLLIVSRGSSHLGTTGAWYSRQNGTLNSNTAWAFNCAGNVDTSASYNMIEVEDDNSSSATTGFAYYDSVYVDTNVITYVYFTNAATIAGSTEFWMQPYTAMSLTSITITQKLGNLGTNYDNVYAYVCQYESCSAGKQLSTAGAGGGGGGSPSTAGKFGVTGGVTFGGGMTIK